MARYNSVNITSSVSGGSQINTPNSGLLTTLTGSGIVTVPNPVYYTGQTQIYYNSTASAITLSVPGGGLIVGPGLGGGASSLSLPAGSIVTLASDGTNYLTQNWLGGNISATTLSASAGLNLTPSTAGTIDNVTIGGNTAKDGTFLNGAFGTTITSPWRVNILGAGTSGARTAQIAGPDVNTTTGGTAPVLNVYNSNNTTNNYTKIAWADSTGTETVSISSQNIDQTNHYGNMVFTTRGSSGYSDKLVLTSNGNVGIGSASPGYKLDVSGTIRTEFYGTDLNSGDVLNITGNGVARALGTGATLTFTVPANTDGTNMWAQARIIGSGDNSVNSDANGAMLLQVRSLYNPGTGGSWNWRTGITIRASGAVGIATNAPTAKLSIKATDGATGGIRLEHSGGNGPLVNLYQSGSDGYIDLYTGENPTILRTHISAWGDTYFTPNNNGKVGIGTATPLEKLQVAGDIRSTSNANSFSGTTGAVFDYYSGSARIASYDGTNVSNLSFSSGGVLTAPLVNAGGRNVRYQCTLDLSNASFLTTTYYPVILPTTQGRTATRYRINSALTGANNPSWSTHPAGFALLLDWSVNGFGYGTIGITRVIHSWSESWTNLRIVGGLDQLGNPSYELVYLRGGGIYYLESDGEVLTPIITTATTTIYGQSCSPTTTAVNNVYNAGSGNAGFGTTYVTSLTSSGAISKASGSFRIDHPLPELTDTHQLVHSFVEGPQADLIYRGTVTLVNGSATVNIDQAAGMTIGTFEVLCRNVQCFTTNETNWDLVKGSVAGNQLTIESQNTSSTATISWLVIGERKDPHMIDTDWTDETGRVIVEPLKKSFDATKPIDGAVMEIGDKTYTYSESTQEWTVESKTTEME